MHRQRVISVVTLATFLPLAVGCSSHRTMDLDSDPVAADVWLTEQGWVKIAGHQLRDGEFHGWEGEVRAAPPDSLEFRRVVIDRSNPYSDSSSLERIRVPRSEVARLELVEFSDHKTAVLGLTIGVVLGAIVSTAFVVVDQMGGYAD